MATSSSTNFELDVADYIEEAFERCGLEVRTGYDMKTAKRSLNLMLAEWANRGLNQWTIVQRTQALTQGTQEYALATDTIDILSLVVRRSDTDFALQRVSRDQFLNIPTKTTQSRPTQFFLDRQVTPNLKVWPTPENSTDTLVFDVLTRMDDADTFTNTLDMPFRFFPCMVSGLAFYLSQKIAPDRIQALKLLYEDELKRALEEDGQRTSVYISPNVYYPQG